MKDLIIPEIIKKEVSSNFNKHNLSNSKQQTLNINLNQNIDRRINNDNRIWNHTETNITNNNKGGFFRFLFDIVTIPFRIIYSIIIFIEKKFNIKHTLKIDKERIARSKWVRKYLKSTEDLYNSEEIS